MSPSPVLPPPAPNPPPPPAALSPSPPPPPESATGLFHRERLTTLSAAGWLAATGAALLLLASIVVVAGRWEAISPEVRFAGLVASLLAVYFAAEALRRRLTTTATALAVLAATITAPVGIAAAATLEQSWPMCILVGGVLAMVATEVQSRRWSVPTLPAATVVAAGLASAGLAALTSTPVAVLGSIAALVAFAVGAEKRGIVLAGLSSAAPFLVLLADAGVGPGTLERLGAIGPSLDWSAPVASLIGAAVIAIAAHRRNSLALVALATAALAVGASVGLFRLELSALVWWSIPAVVTLALQAVIATARETIWQRAARSAAPVLVVPLAFGAAVSPLVVLAARLFDDLSGSGSDAAWMLPTALTALALFASAAAPHRLIRHASIPFTAGCLALVATTLTAGTPLFGWDDVGMLWTIAALTAAVGRFQRPAWLHGAGSLAVAALGASMAVGDLTASVAALCLLAVAAAATGVAFVRSDFGPADTIALCSAGLALVVSRGADAQIQSLVVAAVAAQFTLYATARGQHRIARATGLVSAASALSLWWTTGSNDLVISWLEPYGANGSDLTLAAVSLLLIAAGAVLRRLQTGGPRVSSWLAYSPGLGMAAAWLLDAQFDGDGTWATLGGLAVGVVAVAVGGWRRLGAPLVLGTLLIGVSVVASVGPRLAAAPTWIWIAGAGTGLLLLAAVIERSDRSFFITDPDSNEPSLAQQFCREFD